MHRELPMFAGLPEEADQLLTESLSRKKFGPQSVIFRQGEPLSHLYFILKGEVKVYRTDAAGKEQVVSFQQEGNMFPHIGIFRESGYPANAVAAAETETAVMSVEAFKRLIELYPVISYQLHGMMEEKVMDLQKRLSEMVMNNANERVLLLLVRLARSHGKEETDGFVTFQTRFTNAELANMIGTARETVNRSISGLKARGILQLSSTGTFRIDTRQLKKELYYD
ncbi:Crp/Fnr family transcriptional regulator [Indiicoccus explosivorum]|uniref:Crp/Fnr family transcriptional regulator n=1 Tax=Indiicoccus explosivorum TaxID=1917864 RepID=UPI0013904F61|nr:Crp/Fnr family transcriptional regulator [Indiicoccus explosivorum]